jgi:hypothetical protein
MSDRTPSRAEYIRQYVAAQLAEMHVCMPASVESFDPSKQTVDVQPLVKRRLRAEDGTISFERLPVIRSVPVIYMRAGGFFFYAPLAKGDNVVLHFTDCSLDEWFERGRETEPSYSHAHELTDCFAVPGGYAKPKALSGVGTEDAVIGKEDGTKILLKANGEIHAGAASQFVARAQDVLDRLTSIVNSYNATQVQAGAFATAMGPVTGISGPPVVSMSTPSSVAADELKA